MDGYKITSFFLSSRLLHVPGHLPCGKDGGICRMDPEEEQQCFAEHVACLDAPNGIVLFLVPEAALHYRGPEGPDNPPRLLEAFGFFLGPFLTKQVVMPLSVHMVRLALLAYMESAPTRLTLTPVSDS